jgi:hypothetical protein
MSCEMTQDRLDRLLKGALGEADRAALAAHLAQPCEDCLAGLEATSGPSLLAVVTPASAALTAAEADRMFEASLRPAPSTVRAPSPSPSTWARARAWLWRLAPGLAVAALAVVLLRPPHEDYLGQKGTGEATVALTALLARPGPSGPVLVGPVPPDGAVPAGALVLFRFRLGAPAHLYLLAVERGETKVLWAPDPGDAPWPAGEHELAQAGRVLALDLKALGLQAPRLVAVASPARLADPTALGDPARCPGCGVQALALRAAP